MEALQIHYVDLGVQRVADLKGDMSIGRTEGNDLVLNHPSVSRKHARFEGRSDGFWIVDLKSTNGVKVNGNLVTESKVNSGDKISIGSVQLELYKTYQFSLSGDNVYYATSVFSVPSQNDWRLNSSPSSFSSTTMRGWWSRNTSAQYAHASSTDWRWTPDTLTPLPPVRPSGLMTKSVISRR